MPGLRAVPGFYVCGGCGAHWTLDGKKIANKGSGVKAIVLGFVMVVLLIIFLPIVLPAWLVVAVGWPAGFGLLVAMWRALS
jgi:hypothetical protein